MCVSGSASMENLFVLGTTDELILAQESMCLQVCTLQWAHLCNYACVFLKWCENLPVFMFSCVFYVFTHGWPAFKVNELCTSTNTYLYVLVKAYTKLHHNKSLHSAKRDWQWRVLHLHWRAGNRNVSSKTRTEPKQHKLSDYISLVSTALTLCCCCCLLLFGYAATVVKGCFGFGYMSLTGLVPGLVLFHARLRNYLFFFFQRALFFFLTQNARFHTLVKISPTVAQTDRNAWPLDSLEGIILRI